MDPLLRKSVKILNKNNSSLFNKLYNVGRAYTIPIRSISRIVNGFVPTGKIADVGCGSGLIALYFVLENPKRQIIGYDLNKYRINNLNRAIRKYKSLKNLEFVAKDFVNDTKISSANAVLMVDLLHHLDKKTQVILLQGVRHKLAKGDYLIIKEIEKKVSYKLFITWLLDKIITKGDKINYRSIEEWRELLSSLDYKIKKVERIPSFIYPHFAIVCIPK